MDLCSKIIQLPQGINMRKFVCLFLVFFYQNLFASPDYKNLDYSIVFVHIGKQLPAYIYDAINQARLFNQDAAIFLVANHPALVNIEKGALEDKVIIVEIESLMRTQEHQFFIKNSRLDKRYREGFWTYTTERFFCIDELMRQLELKNVFHLESDNMLYVDLKELLPIFCENYQGIGAVFDHENRCVPSFVYFSKPAASQLLAEHLSQTARSGKNDMETLSAYRKKHGKQHVDSLPIITNEYIMDHLAPRDALLFSNHIALFHSIFDAAAIGQYLGGGDPRLGFYPPGFINETCVFNPSLLTHKWETDGEGRKVPFIIYNNKQYRVNNLHIHAKDLKKFTSNNLSNG